jgi:hypothetical protein
MSLLLGCRIWGRHASKLVCPSVISTHPHNDVTEDVTVEAGDIGSVGGGGDLGGGAW